MNLSKCRHHYLPVSDIQASNRVKRCTLDDINKRPGDLMPAVTEIRISWIYCQPGRMDVLRVENVRAMRPVRVKGAGDIFLKVTVPCFFKQIF